MTASANRRRLVVTDSVSESWMDRARRSEDEGILWFVLPLGVSSEGYFSAHPRLREAFSNVSAVEVALYAEQAQQRIRSFYLPLMYELPRRPLWQGRTLLSELATPQGNLWWFLEISEKSPLRGVIFNQLYFAALVQEVLKDRAFDEVWLCLEDRVLSEALKTLKPPCAVIDVHRPPGFSWRRRVRDFIRRRFTFRLMETQVRYVWRAIRLHLVLCWMSIGRSVNVEKQSFLFFTRYPSLWKKPFSADAEDTMYAGLPGALKRRNPICYGAWLHLSAGETIRRRHSIARLFQDRHFLVLNRLCCIGDLLGLLSVGLFLKLRGVEKRLVSRVRVDFEGVDVSSLIADEIRRSLISTELFNDLLIVKAVSRAVERYRVRGIIHTAEFQPIEKALWYGAMGKIRTVAFQHSTIGNNKLQYHFAPGELAADLARRNPSEDMPLPDFLLTAGRFPFDVMRENGFPVERMGICGAVRYESLAATLRRMPDPRELRKAHGLDPDDRILFITLSLESLDVAVDLVRSVAQAIPAPPGQVELLIKCHPQFPIDREIAQAVRLYGRAVRFRLLPATVPLLDFIILSDAVFLTSSTTALEAAALGRTVVIYDNVSVFTLAPVADVSRIGLVVRNNEEMRGAVEAVLADAPSLKALRETARCEVDRVFSHLDGTACDRFVQFLEAHGFFHEHIP